MFVVNLWICATRSADESEFEKKLLALLCDQLKKSELSIETKLIICVITNRFDNFDGDLEVEL